MRLALLVEFAERALAVLVEPLRGGLRLGFQCAAFFRAAIHAQPIHHIAVDVFKSSHAAIVAEDDGA